MIMMTGALNLNQAAAAAIMMARRLPVAAPEFITVTDSARLLMTQPLPTGPQLELGSRSRNCAAAAGPGPGRVSSLLTGGRGNPELET